MLGFLLDRNNLVSFSTWWCCFFWPPPNTPCLCHLSPSCPGKMTLWTVIRKSHNSFQRRNSTDCEKASTNGNQSKKGGDKEFGVPVHLVRSRAEPTSWEGKAASLRWLTQWLVLRILAMSCYSRLEVRRLEALLASPGHNNNLQRLSIVLQSFLKRISENLSHQSSNISL